MRSIVLSIFVFVATVCVHAQTVQIGVVKEYNEKAQKTPLSGVELNVRSANSTVSDKNGEFSLRFLTLKPGEKVNVRRIEKLGYEIFNKEAIEQWNLNPKNPFVIVMCKSDKFKKIRDNYEKVSSESYAKQLKKEEAALVKLKADGKLKEAEYQKQMFELRESYEKQLDNLENYIDKFSRIDISELNSVEQDIIELVQQGKIEAAIAMYEEQNYVDKYTQEVAQLKGVSNAIDRLEEIRYSKEIARDSLLASIDRQIETLLLAGGQENFDKILDIYVRVIKSGDFKAKTALNYIRFLNSQYQFEKSIQFYNLSLNQINLTLEDKVLILTNIGNSYNQLQQIDEAIDIYKGALSVVDNFHNYSNHYFRYRRNRNIILGNMGIAYQRKKLYNEAERCYKMSSTVCGDENTDELLCIIRSLNNYGILSGLMGNLSKSDSLYQEGLSILTFLELYDNKQKEEAQECFAVLNEGRGNIACDLGNYKVARQYFDLTIKELEDLYIKNPRRYSSTLATAYYNYGRSYILQPSSSEKAIPFLEKSMVYNEYILRNNFVQAVFDNYSNTVANLGKLYSNSNDTIKCLELCDRVETVMLICKDFPYKSAVMLGVLGSIYCDINRYELAEKRYSEAIDAMNMMYIEYPDIYCDDLARLYINNAMTLCRMNDNISGRDFFEKGVSLFEKAANRDWVYKKEYLKSIELGFTFLATTSEYQAGLRYLRKLQDLEPNNIKHFEYECILLYGNGKIKEAKSAFQRLIQRNPSYPHDSVLYKSLGN